MNKVTFRPTDPKKDFGPIVEYTEADSLALRIRAMALNWYIVSIEPC